MPTAYEFIKLGQNVAQLRSIASQSIFLGTSLVEFANLEENQPGVRCTVKKTVDTLRAVLAQLDDFGFTRTLAAMAPLEPMRTEMEEALTQAPPGDELSPRACWPGVADVGACGFRWAGSMPEGQALARRRRLVLRACLRAQWHALMRRAVRGTGLT